MGRDEGRRKAPAAGRRLRARQRLGRLPARRRPPRHAPRRDPPLPARPRRREVGRHERGRDDAGSPRGDHRAAPRARTSRGTAAAGSGTRSSSTPTARYEGDEVAAVAAETRAQAYDALRAIRVEYEELAVRPRRRARRLKPDAPPLHDGGNRVGDPTEYERGDVDGRLRRGRRRRRGDVLDGLRDPRPDGGPRLGRQVGRRTGSRSGTRPRASSPSSSRSPRRSACRSRTSASSAHYMGGGFGSKLEAGKYTVDRGAPLRR